MTTEATPETVTVELSAESAYRQLVGFQQAVVDYNKANEEEDNDARLAAANDAVDACIEFINELMPHELSEALHERLEKEHPELVPEEDPMLVILRELLGQG